MSDNALQDQKHMKKVNFSDPVRSPFSTNKSKGGAYRGRLEEGSYKDQPQGGTYKGQSEGGSYRGHSGRGSYRGYSDRSSYRSYSERGSYKGYSERGSYKDQSEEGSCKGQLSEDSNYSQAHYFNQNKSQYKSNTERKTEDHYNKSNSKSNNGPPFEAGGSHPYYNKNNKDLVQETWLSKSSDFQYSGNRNRDNSDPESFCHGKTRGDHRGGHHQIKNQSRDYESINKNRGGYNASRLQRSRSFGQSGVGKAMENFGVRDLRELLDRRYLNKDDKVETLDFKCEKKNPPPNDPGYNFLQDPQRENPRNEKNGANNPKNQNDNEAVNKYHPNQGLYQPNRNRKIENMPKITIKNQPNKNDDNRQQIHLKHNKPKHNQTTSNTIKDLPNIKIQLTVNNNSRKAQLDESLKIAELKHFPDELKKEDNFRGRGRGGRGKLRSGFRARGMGRDSRNIRDKTSEGERVDNEYFENSTIGNDGEDENFMSEYAGNQITENFGKITEKNEYLSSKLVCKSQKLTEITHGLEMSEHSTILNDIKANQNKTNEVEKTTTSKLENLNKEQVGEPACGSKIITSNRQSAITPDESKMEIDGAERVTSESQSAITPDKSKIEKDGGVKATSKLEHLNVNTARNEVKENEPAISPDNSEFGNSVFNQVAVSNSNTLNVNDKNQGQVSESGSISNNTKTGNNVLQSITVSSTCNEN